MNGPVEQESFNGVTVLTSDGNVTAEYFYKENLYKIYTSKASLRLVTLLS